MGRRVASSDPIERLALLPWDRHQAAIQELKQPAQRLLLESKRTELMCQVAAAVPASTDNALTQATIGNPSSMHVKPSTLGPSAASVGLFGQPTPQPSVDLTQSVFNRPFSVKLALEPSPAERAATQKAILEAMSEDSRRVMCGVGSSDPLPGIYDRHSNLCPLGGECNVNNRVWKPNSQGGGKWRRLPVHLPWCPQQKALDARPK